MTDRLKKAFSGGKVLATFLTCGDPDVETTERLALGAAEAGADLIELGVPFSDPIAESPIIMSANLRAMKSGTTVDDVFRTASRIRKKTDVPIVFVTYANVVFSRGVGTFVGRMASVGADALIVYDVPIEEKDEFALPCEREGVSFVSLAAHSTAERLKSIASRAKGFVQCASPFEIADVAETIKRIKAVSDVPCLIETGISDPAQTKRISELGDGIAVGDATVGLIAKYGKDSVERVAALVKTLKSALRG